MSSGEKKRKRGMRFRSHPAPESTGTAPCARLEDLYELRREIGRGASSVVYEAVSRLSGEPVAVKTIPKCALDMKFFASEVRIMRCLRHPNIVALLDIVESKDSIHLIMELFVPPLFQPRERLCSSHSSHCMHTRAPTE